MYTNPTPDDAYETAYEDYTENAYATFDVAYAAENPAYGEEFSESVSLAAHKAGENAFMLATAQRILERD